MIKALIINKKRETIVELEIYFDTMRYDVCINAFYPFLNARQFDARHFRYDSRYSNRRVAYYILSYVKSFIDKQSNNQFVENKCDLFKLLNSIDYRCIFQK